MANQYRSFVSVRAPILESGWGIYPVSVDGRFTIYCAMTHNYIEPLRSYNFDLFVDIVSEFALFCFPSEEKARDFCKVKSNRYPIFRQLYWLRLHPEYWFGTVCAAYLDAIKSMQG